MGRQLIAEEDFKVDLGKLNCVAASRAASFSAFVPSLEYTEIGLELLDPERRWQNCYALTLEFISGLMLIKEACEMVISTRRSR